MNLKQTLQNTSPTGRHVAYILGALMFHIVIYILVFMVPKPVTFSYAGDTCVRHLTILPSIMQQGENEPFAVGFRDVWQVGQVPLASLSTCFAATEAPQGGQARASLAPFGSPLARQTFAVNVSAPPIASVASIEGKTISVTRPLEVPLSYSDAVHDYALIANERTATCNSAERAISCDLTSLGLDQGKRYNVALERHFNGEEKEVVGSAEVVTLKALKLKSASLKDGQTIYSKPKTFRLTFDKTMQSAEAVLERKVGDTFKPVTSSTSVNEKSVAVSVVDDLPRDTTYRLILKKAESVEGSVLADPLQYDFKLSGGPKVTGISVGGSGAPLSGSLIVSFDQSVANWDKVGALVSVSGISAQPYGEGSQLIIPYSANKCTPFTVTVKKGFTSPAGVAQTKEWKFTSRTQCYTVQSIGSSTQGRPLLAYVFGSGSRTILFTGLLHGNETSSRSLLLGWIDELDANASRIPSGTKVVVLPSLNPDGAAAGSRYNARNVDLNRNFDTSDWKKDIQTVYGQPFAGGGGSKPLSEKESLALANYTSALRPALTLSYHAQAGYAIGNMCGDSASRASTYANMTGYRNMTGVGGAFSYEITGTYDDWICQKLGLPSVLIELLSSSYADSGRHYPAMWELL